MTLNTKDYSLITKTSVDYVSNKHLLESFVEYRKMMAEAATSGLERPQLTRPICEAILQICHRLSTRYNFVNYSYKEEMIGDAIIKCVAKAHLFDPEKSSNPFAYITQIAFNEFVTRIKLEHKQVSVKSKLIKESMTSDFLESMESESDEFKNSFVEFLKMNDTYKDYTAESNDKKKKEKSKSITIEDLIEEDTADEE